ncbi:MAG: T9SS type A sorting domain-containing protein [Crocinitomicaceae bacterium]|nr:T9SS type A sorting domain-containing protein [Crocinitomicaceae bacterium]
MKKQLLTLLAISALSTSFGQQTPQLYSAEQQTPQFYSAENAVHTTANSQGLQKTLPFWTEDFANGFASTNGTWTQGGVDQIWKHNFFTTSGEWSTGTPAFAGTTAGNGFMLFDADSVNFIVTPNYLDRSGELISPSIDCSAEASVELQFEQDFRYCCSAITLLVSVSNDGGATWTDYAIDNGVAVNAASPNPDLNAINISAVAANQANVMIKFSFGGAGNSHYYWIVDDVNLCPAAADDLSILATNFDQTSIVSPLVEYTMYPLNHVRPMEFEAHYTNTGSGTQTGVNLWTTVSNGGIIFNQVNTGADLATGMNDSIANTPLFTASSTGIHTIDYTLGQNETDVAPADNVAQQVFEVTDTTYARDTGMSGAFYSNGTDGYELGNPYEIVVADNITSISVYIDGTTPIGVIMYNVLYMVDAGGNFIYMDQTADYTITASDLDTWKTLSFNNPIAVAAGEQYIACAGHYGGPDELRVGTSGISPPVTSYLLDGSDNTWYYVTATPMVRLNVYTVSGSAPTATSTMTTADCFGNCTGTATAVAAGGTAPYTYLWDDPSAQTTATATGLCAGPYICIITDAIGGVVSTNVVVMEPTALVATGSFTNATSGNSDGTATATANGGSPNYTYLWDDLAGQTTAMATGLPVGTYICTITDANGCSFVLTVMIEDDASLLDQVFGNISISPNPSSDVFNITFNQAIGGNTTLEVLNMIGQVVESIELGELTDGKTISIDAKQWAAGTYVLQLTNGSITSDMKVIKK